jgi:NAD(P)-dependent dehydrogenase (short-subunit alcohol dehydrogenase family)
MPFANHLLMRMGELDLTDFSERVVLITGAAGNLGAAVARVFHAGGANLALFDNRHDRLQSIFSDLVDDTSYLLVGDIDVTDEGSVQSAVERVIEHFGRIDVLINVAGGYRAGDPVHETPVETWDFMLNLNAKSVFLLSRTVAPHMIAQGAGVMVNIGARPGMQAPKNSGAYAASKSAVIRLTESISAELKYHGINVNCVIPGTIDTPENRELMPNAKQENWVSPEAIADVIYFLASEEARAIHGAPIPVYGTG